MEYFFLFDRDSEIGYLEHTTTTKETKAMLDYSETLLSLQGENGLTSDN